MLVYQRVVEGFLQKPPLTGFYDDRWYTKPAQTYFYQKGIIDFPILSLAFPIKILVDLPV